MALPKVIDVDLSCPETCINSPDSGLHNNSWSPGAIPNSEGGVPYVVQNSPDITAVNLSYLVANQIDLSDSEWFDEDGLFNSDVRKKLVAWMIEVCDCLQCLPENSAIAVSLLDMIMVKKRDETLAHKRESDHFLQKNKMQLVSAVCVMLASKLLSQCQYLNISHIEEILPDGFKVEEIKAAERYVLRRLGYSLDSAWQSSPVAFFTLLIFKLNDIANDQGATVPSVFLDKSACLRELHQTVIMDVMDAMRVALLDSKLMVKKNALLCASSVLCHTLMHQMMRAKTLLELYSNSEFLANNPTDGVADVNRWAFINNIGDMSSDEHVQFTCCLVKAFAEINRLPALDFAKSVVDTTEVFHSNHVGDGIGEFENPFNAVFALEESVIMNLC